MSAFEIPRRESRPSPIDILLLTCQRPHFLRHTIASINERTRYPFRLIVVDNGSKDETPAYLKEAKVKGLIQEVITLDNNVGICPGYNAGFPLLQSEYVVITQDDLLPPDLQPDWLERLLHLFKNHEAEGVGSICMRIERTSRIEYDEKEELIMSPKSTPAVFRMSRREDYAKFEDPFGRLNHWESRAHIQNMQVLHKKAAMATHLYASHIGYYTKNKGYAEGFTDYFTYSKERVLQGEEKPYPLIDPKTNVPIKVVHPSDRHEHARRLAYWGMTDESTTTDRPQESSKRNDQHDLLKQYCGTGLVLDIGCGAHKVHPDNVAVDIYPWPNIDILHPGDDLWFFRDGEVDAIVASHSLEHFPDTKKTLREWHRVLKPGGIMAIIVPDATVKPKTISEPGHYVALTPDVMRQIFKRVLNMRTLRLEQLGGRASSFLIVGLKN